VPTARPFTGNVLNDLHEIFTSLTVETDAEYFLSSLKLVNNQELTSFASVNRSELLSKPLFTYVHERAVSNSLSKCNRYPEVQNLPPWTSGTELVFVCHLYVEFRKCRSNSLSEGTKIVFREIEGICRF